MDLPVKYTKITGMFLNFKDGQRIPSGEHYASRKFDLPNKQILIKTYLPDRVIESVLALSGADDLDFSIASNDPVVPVISGRFLNTEYEENILTTSIPDKKINITGSFTRLNESIFLSVKALADSATGKILAIMQEKVELLTQDQFEAATKHFKK